MAAAGPLRTRQSFHAYLPEKLTARITELVFVKLVTGRPSSEVNGFKRENSLQTEQKRMKKWKKLNKSSEENLTISLKE